MADAVSNDIGVTATRRDVVARCSVEGINPGTASTQYGHWKREMIADGGQPEQRHRPTLKSSKQDVVDESSRDWSQLLRGGFAYVANFVLGPDGAPHLDEEAPRLPGVYAIVVDQDVVYVGVTSRTLFARMADYRRGHVRQRTSHHINGRLKHALVEGQTVRLLCASPEDMEWNSLPVVTRLGLEEGLIRRFRPEWNRR